MKILVTGGAGFIGTALSNNLASSKHKVTIVDLASKFTSYHRDHFKCHEIDIRNSQNFHNLDSQKFDIIYHLAAQTSGAISQAEPELDVDTNVKGTLNVCNFARKTKVKKIVLTSSMAVYGNKIGKIKESAPLEPLSNYGCSKVAAETCVKMFGQYGVNHTIFRLFNVYGPGQDMHNLKQGMASIFMSQSITGKNIEVTGSLDRYRDFVYIDDVVAALTIALNGLDNQTCNVGSGRRTTVKQLINLIINCHNKDCRDFTITNIGSHDGDQFGTTADATKISLAGWKPEVKIDQGLKNMYQYAKEVLR